MSSPTAGNQLFQSKFVFRASALALISLSLLTACGGGGGSGSPPASSGVPAASVAAPDTVTTGTGGVLYSGPVTGLGSIVLNGVRFETVGAKVHDADDPYGVAFYSDQIKLGMTVSVEGSADEAKGTGTAVTIRLDGGIRGAVSAIDTSANTLVVSGQSIRVDAKTTVFQGVAGLSGLSASNWVEVYGLPQSDGSFLATRVEAYTSRSAHATGYPNASTYPVSLRGIVSAIAANSFTLSTGANGTSTVNYRAADVLPAGAAILVGSSVRVLAATIGEGAAVAAARVLVLGPSSLLAQSSAAPASGGVLVKLKGVVDSVSGSNIVVSGTGVDLTNAVMPLGALIKGQMVEVRGLLSNGTLIAGKLEFEDRETSYTAHPGGASTAVGYRQELYGTVSGYVSGGNTFTVQGVTVKVDSATRYEHGYRALEDNLYVEVKGVLDNGVLLASKVEVKGVTANRSRGGSTGAYIESNDASSGSASDDHGSGSDDRLSSGGSSFEVYGVLTCSDYPAGCSIAIRNGGNLKTNLSAARWEFEHGGYVPGAALAIEAKGYLDATGIYQVIKIERKG